MKDFYYSETVLKYSKNQHIFLQITALASKIVESKKDFFFYLTTF